MSKEICKTVAVKKVLIPKNIKLIKNKDVIKSGLCREDVLYESMRGDFLNLETPCTIVNKLNLITKHSMTVARFEDGAVCTSENVSKVIGQNKYDTVLSALCTIISHELKIRALLALLTIPKKTRTVSCQTEGKINVGNTFTETSCQTEESSIMMYKKDIKRVKRRQVTPYVVTEANKKKVCKKVIVHPGSFLSLSSSKHPSKPLESGSSDNNDSLPILEFDNDNSNDSDGKLSSITVNTIPGIYSDPLGILDINKVIAPESNQPTFDWTNNTSLTLLDGTHIRIPVKIEDDFHVATPEILKMVAPEHRKKLLWYQVYLDWKHCLTPDEEDCLPIHVAASNGDSDLVRRQCSVLKSRNESVDITTDDNMTALQISIYRNHPRCSMILLFFGADPLVTDDEYRTCFHLAAEADPGHLKGLLKYCFMNPMKILRENQEMWKPELESKPKDYLIKYLLKKISVMFDNQGYTPLMLASKLGYHENVKMLAEASPHTINIQMPNSGNTALYLAVGSACLNASNRGNKSTVSDEFRKTIETLVELGADPAIENHSGSNVNTVLTDLHVGELSMIIANKMTTKNCINIYPNTSNEVGILHKDEHGNIVGYEKLSSVKEIKKEYETINTPLENSKHEPNTSNEVGILHKDEHGNIVAYEKLPSVKEINKEYETINTPLENSKHEPNTSNEVGILHKDKHGNIVAYEKLPSVKEINKEYETINTPLENSKHEPNTSNEVGILHKDKHGNIMAYEKWLRLKEIEKEYKRINNNNPHLKNSKAKDENDTICKETKDKPYILENIKIETTVPIINKKREAPEIKTAIKTEPISPPKKRYKLTNESPKKTIKVENKMSDYMITFRNFVSDVKNAKIVSLMPIIESENLANLMTDTNEEYDSKKDDVRNSVKTILVAKNRKGSNSKIIENEKRMLTYHEVITEVPATKSLPNLIEIDSSEDDSINTMVIAKNGEGSNSKITRFENEKRLQNTHNEVLNYDQLKANKSKRFQKARNPTLCLMKKHLDSSDNEK